MTFLRMVRAIEELPKQLLSEQRHKVTKHAANIAFHAYTVQAHSFPGFTCVAFQPIPPQIGYSEHSLFCTLQQNFTTNRNPSKYMVMADRVRFACSHNNQFILTCFKRKPRLEFRIFKLLYSNKIEALTMQIIFLYVFILKIKV